jgi:hypothetical protein
VLDKVVILSSVSSAERLPSPETSQSNVFMADDNTKNIVSNRTAKHERVSMFADDTDDKNSPLTTSTNLRRFKIGDLVRDS